MTDCASSSFSAAASGVDLWLGKQAPRYTSYPPASAFRAVTSEDMARSLSGGGRADRASLYLHVPFCHELCLYCGCHTSVTHREDRIVAYVEAMKREMALRKAQSGFARRISHVHFGGGTPNILSDATFRDLIDAIRSCFDFHDGHEMAVEMDPRSASASQIKTMAACGVTRVSLGVQDFNGEVQVLVNRVQPYALVERVNGQLRDAGIGRVNFDLMYGLPRQTPASVAETARQVAGLRPDRVALFSYAHVPQIKSHQIALEKAGLPDDRTKLDMDRAARDVLLENGYAEIGIDHFALPGDAMETAWRAHRLHRNFQGYTDDTAPFMIGLGASSISQTPAGFFQNERDTPTYQATIEAGRDAVVRGHLLTDEDRLRNAVIEELMCYLSCDVAAVCRAYGADPARFEGVYPALRPFEEAGLLSRQGAVLTLQAAHRMAIRVVCQAFDAYAAVTSVNASRAA